MRAVGLVPIVLLGIVVLMAMVRASCRSTLDTIDLRLGSRHQRGGPPAAAGARRSEADPARPA
jgi:hypothetical protein